MIRALKTTSVTVLMGLTVLVLAQAQTQQAQSIDQTFIQAAADGDMYEIESSRLALERAASEEVRQFAQRMTDDHMQTTEQLTSIAQQMGVPLPESPSAAHQFMLARLSTLEGEQFDQTYMMQQVQAHQTAVSLFTEETNAGQDETVRGFAEQTLPILQEHLSEAERLAQQLGTRTPDGGGQGSGSQDGG